MDSERNRFEEWYVKNAFNYVRDPIGSRDCSLQWAAWQAGSESHRAELAECQRDVDRYRWLRRAREHVDVLMREDEDSMWMDMHGIELDAAVDEELLREMEK